MKQTSEPQMEEKSDSTVITQGYSLLVSLFRIVLLVLIGAISATIPEAASTALKLKWFTLLGSLLPIPVHYTSKPKKAICTYTTLALLCNSLILIESHFVNKMYLKWTIRDSSTLMNSASQENRQFGDYVFPFYLAVFGLYAVSFAVGGGFRACKDNRIFKRVFLVSILLISIGLVSIHACLIPSLPFRSRASIKIAVDGFFTFLRPGQAVISCCLVVANLTCPWLPCESIYKKVHLILIADMCLVHGTLCLWSGVQIPKLEFVSSGIIASLMQVTVVCLVAIQLSIPVRNGGNRTGEKL